MRDQEYAAMARSGVREESDDVPYVRNLVTALDGLDKDIALLVEDASILIDRLEMVLKPSGPEVADGGAIPTRHRGENASLAVCRVEEARERLDHLRYRLGVAMQRMDL